MAAPKLHFSVFDGRLLQNNTEDGLREVHSFTAEPPPSVAPEQTQRETTLISDVPDKMVCTTCRWPLNNREEQRVSGQAPVTVEEFETKTGADDDDVCLSAQTASSHLASKVFFQTTGGQYLVVHRCVLQGKTFHRYTVRAKRGTAQGLRDAQNRGHAPKSAEASAIFLRAPSYNKTIFFGGRGAPMDKKDPRIRTLPFATRRATFREVQRVHILLSTVQTFEKETDLSAVFSPTKKQWKKTLKSAAQSNSSEEKEAADSSDDEELGGSVLETAEVELGTLHLREHEVQPSRHRKKKRKKKEANKMDDELNIMGEADQLMEGDKEEEEEEEEEVLLTPPPENTSEEMPMKSKAKRKGKSKKKQLEDNSVDESWEYSLRDALYTACKTGDIDALRRLLLQLPAEENEGEEPGGGAPLQQQPSSPVPGLVNKALDSSGFTLLHVSSAAGQKAAEIELKQTEKKKAQKAAKKQREKEQKEERRRAEQEVEEKRRFASLTDREKAHRKAAAATQTAKSTT
ncbi:hypothetical protein CRUP_011330 [Coryphaenoides rupestris]|nr:hypothetical protein CRUP_011330 [Coryphaenoides rupestris]